MSKNAWGIDISNSSIKAVLFTKDGDSLTLAAVDVEELPRGGTDQAQLDAHIREGLTQLASRNRMKGQVLACSIPGHTVFNRPIKLPPVDAAKLGEVVRYEAQQQIPFPLNEVVWDYHVVDRKYGVGEEREVILFAIKRDVVDHFLGLLQSVGLQPQIMQFSPVALYNFLVHDQDTGTASVALDLGADNTDLVVVDGPRCWIRNLPITGNDLTKAIQKAFNIPAAEAEKLKLSAGQSQQGAKIFAVLQPVLKDLVGEIHRSIGYYKSISRQSKFDKIFLMGNGSKVINFQKFASQNLQLLATKVAALAKIAIGGSVDQNALQKYLPTLGPAMGLALQAHGDARMSINLLPEEERVKREQAKRKPVAAAAVVLLALPVWLWGSAVRDEAAKLAAANREAVKLNDRNVEMVQKRQETMQPIPRYEKELATLGGLVTERDLALKVLNKINQLVKGNDTSRGVGDDNLWLLSCEMVEKPPQAAPPAGAQASRFFPPSAACLLELKIEGAIKARQDTAQAQAFVKERLSEPLAKEFFVGSHNVEVEPQAVTKLKPKSMAEPGGGPGLFGGPQAEGETKYHRFTAVLQIKFGPEARKPAPAVAPPAGGAPPAGNGGGAREEAVIRKQ